MNMVALVDNQPRLLNLKELLEHFVAHRREVVTRRTRFELRKARERGPHPGGPRRRAVERRRDHRADQGLRDAARGQGRADGARLALGAGRGDARARGRRRRRPDGSARVRVAAGREPGRLPALRRARRRRSSRLRLQRLTGLEQDKIHGEYREVMALIVDLLDILARPERVTVIVGDELTAVRDEFGDKRRIGDRRRRARPVDRGPDHAAGHGRHDLARRLHQGAAARRVPRAEARRPRQAGDGDEGGRLRRAAVHRQHARLHPVLLRPRPRRTGSRSTTCRRAAASSRGKPIVNLVPLVENEKITAILPVREFAEGSTCSWPRAWAP